MAKAKLYPAIFAILLTFSLDKFAYSSESTHEVVRSPLKFAPFKFSMTNAGSIGYTVRQLNSSTSGSSTDQSMRLIYNPNLQAITYIWQPWFSRVFFGVGVGLSQNLSHSTRANTDKSSSYSNNGSARIVLLPQSRYPFQASIRNDNERSKSGLTANTTKYHSTQVEAIQNYGSSDGLTSGILNFNHSTIQDYNFNLNKRDSFNLGFQHRPFTSQSINTQANVTRELFPYSNSRSLSKTFTTSHALSLYNQLSVNSTMLLYDVNSQQKDKLSEFYARQFNSLASWRSSWVALTVNSGLRIFNSERSKGSNIFLDTTYAFSTGMRASSYINVNDSADGQVTTTNFSISAGKGLSQSSGTKLGSFLYKKNITGSISSQSTSNSGSQQSTSNSQTLSVNGALGQSLTGNFSLFNGSLATNVNQILSTSTHFDNLPLQTSPLVTSGSIRWASRRIVSDPVTTVRVTFSDSRYIKKSTTLPQQLLNLQVSQNQALQNSQSLIGNLTAQASHQGGDYTSSASADINYINNRVLKIKNLIFTSIIRVTQNPNSNSKYQSSTSFNWVNDLVYTISFGKLDLKIDANRTQNDYATNSLLFFSMIRKF